MREIGQAGTLLDAAVNIFFEESEVITSAECDVHIVERNVSLPEEVVADAITLVVDRHPYVFKALCIRAEGIRINFVPKVFGDPMYSMSMLHHRWLFKVGLQIIGVTQELHVLVFVSVTTCDSALPDCDFRRNFHN